MRFNLQLFLDELYFSVKDTEDEYELKTLILREYEYAVQCGEIEDNR